MYEIKQILKDKPFVHEIESLSEEKRKTLFLRYSKIILSNYSSLHIKEIWRDDQLFKYAYYWFSANNTLILGWDNAPHHNTVKSFPHHKHTTDGVAPSDERNLVDVIDYIADIF